MLVKKSIQTFLPRLNRMSFNLNLNFVKFTSRPKASAFARLMIKEKALKKEDLKKEEELTKSQNLAKKTSEETSSKEGDREKGVGSNVLYTPSEVITKIKSMAHLKDFTINLVLGLNVDIKRGDQNVRGIWKMPGGSTKIPKLVVFTSPQYHEVAKLAGADMIGDEETIKDIQAGKIEFDKCVSTIDMLPMLKAVGRILGPKGLMPNAKIGTATTVDKLDSIIRDIKTGSREFRLDIYGQVMVPVGRISFSEKNTLLNIDAFMNAISNKKPEGIKGRYFLYAYMSTKNYSYRIDMKMLDPKSSSYFMTKLSL